MYNPSQSSNLLNNLAARYGTSNQERVAQTQALARGTRSTPASQYPAGTHNSGRYSAVCSQGQQLHSISGILRKAGLLTDADLQEAAEIAQTAHSSVDQILRNSAFVTALQYENAQKARQFITMNLSMEDLVLSSLRIAFTKNVPLEEGMKSLGWSW